MRINKHFMYTCCHGCMYVCMCSRLYFITAFKQMPGNTLICNPVWVNEYIHLNIYICVCECKCISSTVYPNNLLCFVNTHHYYVHVLFLFFFFFVFAINFENLRTHTHTQKLLNTHSLTRIQHHYDNK